MTPEQITALVTALVTLIATAAGAFIAIYRALKENTETTRAIGPQLVDIHTAVNGGLAKARADLATALAKIDALTATLKTAGIALPPDSPGA